MNTRFFRNPFVIGGFVLIILGIVFTGKTFLLKADAAPSNDVHIYSGANPDSFWMSQTFIAFSSQQEPSLKIDRTQQYNEVKDWNATVDLYSMTKEEFLNYLSYTKKETSEGYGETTFNRTFSLDSSKRIGSFPMSSKDAKLVLPIGPSGIWLARATMSDGLYNEVLIVRSDIATVAKEGDNQFLFWTQQASTGRSVFEGRVETYRLENFPILQDIIPINKDGVAQAKISTNADVAFVTSGTDVDVVILNLPTSYYSNYSTFSPRNAEKKYFLFTDRPLYAPGDTVNFKSIIRDDDDGKYLLPTQPARVRIYEGYDREKVVFEKTYPVSTQGSIDGTFVIPESQKTGRYHIEIVSQDEINRETWLRTVVPFDIQFYRKPEYSISVDTSQKMIVKGDNAHFTISGDYFFGQPLTNKKVSYKIDFNEVYDSEYYYEKENSDEYLYGWWYGGKTISESQVTLDEKGKGLVTISTKDLPNKDGVVIIEASYKDDSGNTVVSQKQVFVRASEYGLYRSSYYYSSKVGEVFSMPMKVVSFANASVANVPLGVQIMREEWVRNTPTNPKDYSYTKKTETLPQQTITSGANGELVFSFVPSKPGSYTFTFTTKDKRGNTLEKKFYGWVRAEGEASYWYEGNDDEGITIKTDKESYRPGENVKLFVSSKQPNRDVLLTLERGFAYRYKIAKLEGNNGEILLPTTESDLPNMYVTGSTFADSKYQTDMVPIKLVKDSKKVVVDMKLNQKGYRPGDTVALDITTNDGLGNPVSSEVTVWAVDKALYELSDLKPVDAFEAFWQDRYNGTQSAHSYQGISMYGGAEKGCFVGDTLVKTPTGDKMIKDIRIGDTILTRKSETDDTLVEARVHFVHKHEVEGYLTINGTFKVTPQHVLWLNGEWRTAGDIQIGDMLLGENGESIQVLSIEWLNLNTPVFNLEVEKYHTFFADGVWVHNDKGGDGTRSEFEDVAYWNPKVRTNSSGFARVTFTLPDNLTTWIIQGVAVTERTQVGQGKIETIVTKPIIVRPLLPNIIRMGDTLSIAALSSNYTTSTQSFKLTGTFDSGKISGGSDIRIDAGSTKEQLFTITPEKITPAAKLTLDLNPIDGSNEKDSITSTFPVREFGYNEKRGAVGQGNFTFTVEAATPLDKVSKAEITLTPSLFGTLPHAMDYLLEYPYGCVEQTTSRFVPAVIAKQYKTIFAPYIGTHDLDKNITIGIERLEKLMDQSGGWSWWGGNNRFNPFVTAYVVEYLTRAKELGYTVDGTTLTQTRISLEGSLLNTYQPLTASEKVAVQYALTMLGSKQGKTLISDFKNFTPDVVALAVITNMNNGFENPAQNGYDYLLSLGEKNGDMMWWNGGPAQYFGSTDASTALALRAILIAGNDQEPARQAARYLAQSRRSQYWSNTFGTAQAIEAIAAYTEKYQDSTPNLTYAVSVDGKEVKKGTFTSLFATETIPISVHVGSKIAVTKMGIGELYSTLVSTIINTERDAVAYSHGLTVERAYESRFGIADEVDVYVKVSGLPDNSQYLVIEDQLPSGFIPVNTLLANEGDKNAYYKDFSWYYGSNRLEFTENGAIATYEYVQNNEVTLHYRARIVSRGIYDAPSAFAQLMYSPDIYGRSNSQKFTISGDPQSFEKTLLGANIIPKKFKSTSVTLVSSAFGTLAGIGLLVYLHRRKQTKPEEKKEVEKVS